MGTWETGVVNINPLQWEEEAKQNAEEGEGVCGGICGLGSEAVFALHLQQTPLWVFGPLNWMFSMTSCLYV